MKKFLLFILSTITYLTALILTFSLFINISISQNTTAQIIDNIDFEKEINNFKSNQDLSPIYEEIEKYGIKEEEFDQLLQSPQAKNYYNQVVQKIIKNEKFTQEEAQDITDQLIDRATSEYNLNLEANQKEEMQKNISNMLQNETNNIIVDNMQINSPFLTKLRTINFNLIIIILGIIFLVEIVLIIILNWKNKKYFKSLGSILLTLSISVLVFIFLINILLSIINQSIDSIDLINLLKPILNKEYILGSILLIISIILFIIYKIRKNKVN